MPHMAEQDGGHDDVEVPPQHEQGDHQHPQRAYRAVRLPWSTNRLLDRILRNQDEQMRLLTLHGHSPSHSPRRGPNFTEEELAESDEESDEY
ncbi:hypothetical protein Hanom_Chr01g00028861 [Helianthus anomalus]